MKDHPECVDLILKKQPNVSRYHLKKYLLIKFTKSNRSTTSALSKLK